MRTAAHAAAVLALAAGCAGGRDEALTVATPPAFARPLALEPTPRWAARACRASRLLRPACPRRLPAGRYRTGGLRLAAVGPAGKRFDFLALVDRRTTAPRVLRLVVLASRYGLGKSVGGAFAAWPKRRAERVALGALRGELAHDRSDPSAPRGRLVFRWQARGVDYAVALHAWKPLRQAEATLRAVVMTTRAAQGS